MLSFLLGCIMLAIFVCVGGVVLQLIMAVIVAVIVGIISLFGGDK